ncbi:MAG: NADPH-dependent F420 reductase [Pseudanabaena sp. M57BS1SP1A06MG]|jgi:predicted dinucleotide-binding enzyme|nr:NADPH-dependent F420 reductase [Pseudanabaena sp. M53BS1SP1A06MG]MCA6582465.1 NADPH-dependent F420 reductase [Pseudanabaena sp. M34BS1SP1A06MG]MCA6593996.1 NADPH-dependent F420 reductase [Pseudanabaena sp. M38BS1SP1A06MG]MCA6600505.1 NADPH-dependent F420 reductase [Pseudanabaena sp. M57BS1SP1A06MG]
MRIAFIGTGNVGAPLADRLQKLGHQVFIAARNPESKSVLEASKRNSELIVKSLIEAVQEAEIVFLATPFNAIETALAPVKSLLDGKILVDCTNPVGANLSHGLQSQISGSETVQEFVPNAHVVKAFTIYGFENFEDSTYAGYGDLKPAMLIAGNNQTAKEMVSSLCSQLGWEPVDTGKLSMSLHLEHMTLLWIQMARVQGKGSGFVWAMLQR